jgi:hypothetical protein
MNIFISDLCPVQSAQNLDSKRVVKMILESAQLLSNSMNFRGLKGPYLETHENHPCSIAVQTNQANYTWLIKHFKALCEEYTFRYNKEHKCAQFYKLFLEHTPSSEHTTISLPNCTKFKSEKDLITAYRNALLDKWSQDKHKPKWSGPFGKRMPPNWAINAPWFTLYSNHEVSEND